MAASRWVLLCEDLRSAGREASSVKDVWSRARTVDHCRGAFMEAGRESLERALRFLGSERGASVTLQRLLFKMNVLLDKYWRVCRKN